jgi:hypothetical protein
MKGLITETELGLADQVFPGIAAFFASLAVKPATFLELVSVFDHWCDRACTALARGSSSSIAMTSVVLDAADTDTAIAAPLAIDDHQ